VNAPPLALPGPLFFFLAAMAVAVVAYLLHRWTFLSGLVSSAGCLTLGGMAYLLLLDRPLSLFGRSLVLGPSFLLWGREWTLAPSRMAVLAFVLIVTGLIFALALHGPQGWSFYPFGVGVVGVLSLAITAQQYIYAVLLLWLAAVMAVFVLAGGRPGATMGAFRFLALTTLAVMPLLILPHYLEPDAPENALQVASILMIVGFGILFMMPPFHGQLVAVSAHAAPMALSLVLSVFPPVVFQIFFTLGQAHPALLEDGFMFSVCRWMGVAAAVIGGLVAAGQRRWGSLVGYAALVDWGAGLIALGQGTRVGMAQAAQMLVWRAFSLLLTGSGLTAIFQATDQNEGLEQCSGLLYRRPLSVLALFGGLFSLAGFPLTPGAAGRWPLILDLLASDSRAAWPLILAGAGVGVGALSGLKACLSAPAPERQEDRRRMMVSLAFGLLTLWLVGYLFSHPAPWLEIVERTLAEFTFLEVV